MQEMKYTTRNFNATLGSLLTEQCGEDVKLVRGSPGDSYFVFYFDPVSGVVTVLHYDFLGLGYRTHTFLHKKKSVVIVNSDISRDTFVARVAWRVVKYLENNNIPHCFVSFSSLGAATLHAKYLNVVDFTPATYNTYKRYVSCTKSTCGKTNAKMYVNHTHIKSVRRHFMGETLFVNVADRKRRLYITGLDRNEFLKPDAFYLTQLPKKAKPETVEQALDALRPPSVPKGSVRQGEWFFVPKKLRASFLSTVSVHENIPIVFDKVPLQSYVVAYVGAKTLQPVPQSLNSAFRGNPPVTTLYLRSRGDRHRAEYMCFDTHSVYVKGRVNDPTHAPITLPDWCKVVRNLADGSWQAGGNVD